MPSDLTSPEELPLCLFCQKPFQRTRRGHRYCSDYCRNKANTRNRGHDEVQRKQRSMIREVVETVKKKTIPLIVKHNESKMPLTPEEWIALIGEVPSYRTKPRKRIDLIPFITIRGEIQ